MRLCKNDNCDKRAIDHSDYCGEHTSNEEFLDQISNILLASEKKVCDNLFISEVELDSSLLIEGKEFNNCEFNDCRFENLRLISCVYKNCFILNIEFINCIVENCSFIDCEIDQTDFSESTFNGCVFQKSELTNCEIIESTSIKNTKFEFCKFSNVDFFEVLEAKGTEFNQCIFVRASFNECNLDYTVFKHTEFSKTAISFCSIRYSGLVEITEDFKSTGPPLACDFFGSKIDNSLKNYLCDYYNNFDHSNISHYIEDNINKLIEVNHPNYLPELTHFINKYKSVGGNPLEFKNKIILFYKKLYELAFDTNNVMMAGSVINEYSRLPNSIRGSLLLLASPNRLQSDESNAYLTISFGSQENLTFKSINESNRLLSKLSSLIELSSEYNVVSIRKGSFIEVINGGLVDISIVGGLLYSGSKAVLSIVKQGVEIRKLTAETKKIELENRKIQDEIGSKQETSSKIKAESYIESLKEDEMLQEAELERVEVKIMKLTKNSNYIKIIRQLDSKFKIQRIEIKKED